MTIQKELFNNACKLSLKTTFKKAEIILIKSVSTHKEREKLKRYIHRCLVWAYKYYCRRNNLKTEIKRIGSRIHAKYDNFIKTTFTSRLEQKYLFNLLVIVASRSHDSSKYVPIHSNLWKQIAGNNYPEFQLKLTHKKILKTNHLYWEGSFPKKFSITAIRNKKINNLDRKKYYAEFSHYSSISGPKFLYKTYVLINVRNNKNEIIFPEVSFNSKKVIFNKGDHIRFKATTDPITGQLTRPSKVEHNVVQFNRVNQKRMSKLLKYYLPFRQDFVFMNREIWRNLIGSNYKSFQNMLVKKGMLQIENKKFKLNFA